MKFPAVAGTGWTGNPGASRMVVLEGSLRKHSGDEIRSAVSGQFTEAKSALMYSRGGAAAKFGLGALPVLSARA